MEKTGIIYKATCVMNEKVYIGQTIKSINTRKNLHISNAKNKNSSSYNTKFSRALRKYGINNFIWEIIQSNIPQLLLDETEVKTITKYNSYNVGYNSTIGGEGNKGYKHTEKTKQVISKKAKGRKHTDEAKEKMSKNRKGKTAGKNNPMYGKHCSEETKKKISKSLKGKTAGKNNPMYGKHHTEKTRQKISKSLKNSDKNKGEKGPNSKLNWEKVHEIRSKYANGKYTHLELGKQYGVSKHTIFCIIHYKTWIEKP